METKKYFINLVPSTHVKTRVIVDGRILKVSVVDRGKLLLYSPQEWYKRTAINLARMARRGFILICIITLLSSPFPFLLLTQESALAFLGGYLIGASIGLYLIKLIIAWEMLRSGVVPGLYSHGFQVPRGETRLYPFIPYSEISDVRIKRHIFLPSGEVRYRRNEKRIYFDPAFLGEEGMAFLLSHIGNSPSFTTQAPPRLNMYPSQHR